MKRNRKPRVNEKRLNGVPYVYPKFGKVELKPRQLSVMVSATGEMFRLLNEDIKAMELCDRVLLNQPIVFGDYLKIRDMIDNDGAFRGRG